MWKWKLNKIRTILTRKQRGNHIHQTNIESTTWILRSGVCVHVILMYANKPQIFSLSHAKSVCICASPYYACINGKLSAKTSFKKRVVSLIECAQLILLLISKWIRSPQLPLNSDSCRLVWILNFPYHTPNWHHQCWPCIDGICLLLTPIPSVLRMTSSLPACICIGLSLFYYNITLFTRRLLANAVICTAVKRNRPMRAIHVIFMREHHYSTHIFFK